MLEIFEDRVSSLEDRIPRIEKQGFLEYAKTRKGFKKTNNTVLLTPKVQMFRVDRYRMKTFDRTIAD